MTPTLLTAQRALALAQDRFLPPKWSQETTGRARLLGRLYRSAKLVVVDGSEDALLGVVNHEVFGHGYRCREFAAVRIEYRFSVSGEGSTECDFPGRSLESYQLLAIDIGGLEADNIVVGDLARRALTRGTMHYREASLYLMTFVDALAYVLSAEDNGSVEDDVSSFLLDLNARNDGGSPLSASVLKRRALLSLADPLAAYAAYGLLVSYIWNGEPYTPLPTMSIGSRIRYLPSLGFQLAPFGTEWISQHFFIARDRLVDVSLRWGDARTSHSWGTRVAATNLVHTQSITAGAALELWRQPVLGAAAGSSSISDVGGLGMVTLRVRFPAFSGALPQSYLALETGAKSLGFVAGERLSRGAFFRVGLSFRDRFGR